MLSQTDPLFVRNGGHTFSPTRFVGVMYFGPVHLQGKLSVFDRLLDESNTHLTKPAGLCAVLNLKRTRSPVRCVLQLRLWRPIVSRTNLKHI